MNPRRMEIFPQGFQAQPQELSAEEVATHLENRLAGLASSRLGGARIRVLLNGCTDDSRPAARLPGRDYMIHEALAGGAEYEAFPDNDVSAPADW